MPRLTVDMKEAVSFQPVPDATYEVTITAFQDVRTSAKGAKFVPVELTVSDGGEFDGRKLFMNLMLGGGGAGITENFLEQAGVPFEKNAEGGIEFDTDDGVGCKVAVVTKQSEYPEGSGNFRAEVKKVLTV
jgi:hypothetical protein